MSTNRLASVIGGFIIAFVILAFGVFMPLAHGDEWNQRTKVTFSNPVQVPGRVLPAGTYWFKLAHSDANRGIVQIYGADERVLFATILTASSERLKPSDQTSMTLAERPSNQPPALIRWYYPGDTLGHEFLYPRSLERELAHDKQNMILLPETHARGL
jgi:hypothetical protein